MSKCVEGGGFHIFKNNNHMQHRLRTAMRGMIKCGFPNLADCPNPWGAHCGREDSCSWGRWDAGRPQVHSRWNSCSPTNFSVLIKTRPSELNNFKIVMWAAVVNLMK